MCNILYNILGLNYNASCSFFFTNATKIYQFKAKVSENKSYTLCLYKISTVFTMDNMKKQTSKQTKKTILKGAVKAFYVDYNVIYLYVFGFVKKMFVGLLSVCAIGSFAASSALTSQNIKNVYL